MRDVQLAVTTALASVAREDIAGAAEKLADILGFIKFNWGGTKDVRGIHRNTRQGFMVIGSGGAAVDTSGIRIKPKVVRRALPGRCANVINGEVCGGMLAVVGDVARCGLCGTEAEAPAAARPGGAAPMQPHKLKAPAVRPGPPLQSHNLAHTPGRIPKKNPWRGKNAVTVAPMFADLQPAAAEFAEGKAVITRTGAPIAPMMPNPSKTVADAPDDSPAQPSKGGSPLPAELADALEAPAPDAPEVVEDEDYYGEDEADREEFDAILGETENRAEALALMEAEAHLHEPTETLPPTCGLCGMPIDSSGACGCRT